MTAEQLGSAPSLTGIASVQHRFSLVVRRSADVLTLCEKHSLAFLTWFPTAP